jgi:hypothetical protein
MINGHDLSFQLNIYKGFLYGNSHSLPLLSFYNILGSPLSFNIKGNISISWFGGFFPQCSLGMDITLEKLQVVVIVV